MSLTTVDQGLLGTYAQYTGFKNRIINGAMVIDQRNAGASVTLTSGGSTSFAVDRFYGYYDTSATSVTNQQVTDVPSGGGFINSLKWTTGTGGSATATQQARIVQTIEGLNVADLMWGSSSAKTITVSFWVKSSLTGTFSCAVQNSAVDRSYVATYTISSSNTWEQKSITIAGDTTGTWLTTNGTGIRVSFDLGSGSNRQTTANTWTAGNYHSQSSQPTVIGNNGATFYITGVQLEKGSTATSFDYRPYGTELALCQRYAYKFMPLQSSNNVVPATVYGLTTLLLFAVPLPVTMRATPSSTLVTNPGSGFTWWRYDGGATSTQIPTSIAFNPRGGAPNIIEVVLTAASSWGSANNIGTLAAAGSDTGSTILSAEL